MFCLLVSLLSLDFGCVKRINISLSNQTTTGQTGRNLSQYITEHRRKNRHLLQCCL